MSDISDIVNKRVGELCLQSSNDHIEHAMIEANRASGEINITKVLSSLQAANALRRISKNVRNERRD